ncbi:MFS transporter [Diaminobutyricibacter tongyongensis]|uniref:MFS transporter n=1 Tax=Leifsonia tongyongensis TaxID=1268043 RepID=A0A6L9Y069_9MICO|nr:MFS transporter [Diaminobutyricibacter tongyongensis]NEN07079.1 MFS transporter [Diaminobutyricibacter tongyongensis]
MTDTLPAAKRQRSPLRQRNFALVWSSSFVSDAGDWLLMIALPLFAFAVTGSALGASTVFLAELLPALVLGSFLGVLVDRWDHRRTMIVVNLLQGLFLLPLLFASAEHIWIVYIVAAVEACLAALFNPARQALVPRLVEPDQLGTGNSLMAVSENLARLIGSPLGGLAFATVGLPGVVMVDAATYVVSAILVAASRPIPAPAEAADGPLPRIHFLHQWVDGLSTIRRTRPLGTIAVLTLLGQFAQGIFLVLFIVYVVQQLDAGDTAVGLLRGVQAIGGVAGGLLVGVLIRRVSPRALVGWGFVLFGAISMLTWNLYSVTTAIGVYVALFIVVGIPAVATTAGEITIVQKVTPPDALGRVIASVQTLGGAAQGLGLLAAGLLVQHVDVVTILNGQATVYILCGLIGLAFLGRRSAPGADPATPAGPPSAQ